MRVLDQRLISQRRGSECSGLFPGVVGMIKEVGCCMQKSRGAWNIMIA